MNMNTEAINSYIINVRRFIAPFLKPNVSMRFVIYPFNNGAVMVAEFGFNGDNNTTFESKVSTMNEAIAKTNLFDAPNELQPINGTKFIIGNGRVVIIKGIDASWSEKDAETDVKKILSTLPKD